MINLQLYKKIHFKEYKETTVIHKNEYDPFWENKKSICAEIGMRRKGIAIAFLEHRFVKYVSYPNTYYLINKNNEVIFELKVEYKERNLELYHNRIYRTIKGFYVIEYKGLEIRNRVGRDDQEIDYFNIEVLDENGIKVEKWDNEQIGINKEPNYMGYGIFEYNNTFYDSESLNELFSVPNNFNIRTIFENDLALLSDKNSYAFVITVRNKRIISQNNITNLKEIKEKYEKEERAFYSQENISLSSISKTPESIENDSYIEKYGYLLYGNGSISRPYEEEVYISEKNYIENESDFHKLENIDNNDINILNSIRRALPFYQSKQKNRYVFRLDKNINVFIYENIFVLTTFSRLGKLYSFYGTNGKRISKYIYIDKLWQISSVIENGTNDAYWNQVSFEKILDYSNQIFLARTMDYKQCIARFENNMFIESEIKTDENLKGYNMSLKNGYIKFLKSATNTKCDVNEIKYFNFDMQPIKITYIPCHIETIIENYLYALKENFLNTPGPYYSFKEGFLSSPPTPLPTWINGQLCLPFPKSYEDCWAKLQFLNSRRANNVSSITKIKSYLTNEGKVILYKFTCSSYAYCDRFGNIYSFFNPDNIHFL